LLASFTGKRNGEPLGDYLAAVRKRFGPWILNTPNAEHDRSWLDYQHEIGLRHHRTKKKRADGAGSTAIVPFGNPFLPIFPVMFALKPSLAKKHHSARRSRRCTPRG